MSSSGQRQEFIGNQVSRTKSDARIWGVSRLVSQDQSEDDEAFGKSVSTFFVVPVQSPSNPRPTHPSLGSYGGRTIQTISTRDPAKIWKRHTQAPEHTAVAHSRRYLLETRQRLETTRRLFGLWTRNGAP